MYARYRREAYPGGRQVVELADRHLVRSYLHKSDRIIHTEISFSAVKQIERG
jgi:hypothetical protein